MVIRKQTVEVGRKVRGVKLFWRPAWGSWKVVNLFWAVVHSGFIKQQLTCNFHINIEIFLASRMIFDINFVMLYKFYSLFLMANLIKTFIVKHQRLLSVNCIRSINEPAWIHIHHQNLCWQTKCKAVGVTACCCT